MSLDRTYDDDKIQCTATTQNGKRCTRIGTHGNGGKHVLCELHHGLYQIKRANDVLILRTKK